MSFTGDLHLDIGRVQENLTSLNTSWNATITNVLDSDNESTTSSTPHIVLGTLVGITFLVSLLGNGIVFLVVCNTNSLRRLNNALIISLAAVDLTRTVLVMPMYTVLTLVLQKPLPPPLCPVYHGFHISCEFVSIYSLAAISIERVFVITKPMIYQRVMTKSRMAIFIAVLWILGFAYGLLQMLWFDFSTLTWMHVLVGSPSQELETCDYNPVLGYAIFDFILCMAIPLVVMVGCYGKIFRVVQSQIRRIVPTLSTVIDQSDVTNYPQEQSQHSRRSSIQGRHGYQRGSIDSRVSTLASVAEAYVDDAQVSRVQMQESRRLSDITDSPQNDNEATPSENCMNESQSPRAEVYNYSAVSNNSGAMDERDMLQITDLESEGDLTNSEEQQTAVAGCSGLQRNTNTVNDYRRESIISQTQVRPEVIIRVDRLTAGETLVLATHGDNSRIIETRDRSPTVTGDPLNSPTLTVQRTLRNSRCHSDPEVQPLGKTGSSSQNLHPVLKRTQSTNMKSSYLQTKRGSVTFRLGDEDQNEARASVSSTNRKKAVPNLRVVALDDDTTYSSEAATTDTSLSSSGLTPHLPRRGATRVDRDSSFSQGPSSVSSSNPLSQTSHYNSSSMSSITTSSSSRSRNAFRLNQNKAIKMMTIVIGAFMVCWLPYNITFLVRKIQPELVSRLAWDIVSALVFVSSAINPFIYNFYSSEFRRAFKRIIMCKDRTNFPWA